MAPWPRSSRESTSMMRIFLPRLSQWCASGETSNVWPPSVTKVGSLSGCIEVFQSCGNSVARSLSAAGGVKTDHALERGGKWSAVEERKEEKGRSSQVVSWQRQFCDTSNRQPEDRERGRDSLPGRVCMSSHPAVHVIRKEEHTKRYRHNQSHGETPRPICSEHGEWWLGSFYRAVAGDWNSRMDQAKAGEEF